MIEINYSDIVTDELMQGAILNKEFPGFLEDYSVLHCLLKISEQKYKKLMENVISKDIHFSVFEIGTNMGTGTKIICNAVKDGSPYAVVYSLDLPEELAHISLKGNRVGSNCKLPFTQFRGDSLRFNYSRYPSYVYFIDGNHTEENVTHETKEALKCKPDLVIYHDSNIPEVMAGILAGLGTNDCYELYRVVDTRISYLQKKRVQDLTYGGIVSGPNNAYFGDDKPEQIIPLDKLKDCIAKPKKARKKK